VRERLEGVVREAVREVVRAANRLKDHHLTDWAAALTYYGMLALFPATLAIVSVIGLVADPVDTTEALTDIAESLGPAGATETFRGPIESLTANRSRAGVGLVVGLLVAVWSASSYLGAFTRASSVIHETPDTRPFWKTRPVQLLLTVVMVVLAAAVALSLVLSGPLVEAVGEAIGAGDTTLTVWSVAKWPIGLLVVVLMVCLVYIASSTGQSRRLGKVLPGALLAVSLWVLASVAFAVYVSSFGRFDKTYGALAGVIVFLIWLYVTNVAMLLGAELNADRAERAQDAVVRSRGD
jgi:membrane protein